MFHWYAHCVPLRYFFSLSSVSVSSLSSLSFYNVFINDTSTSIGDFDRRRFFHALRDNDILFVSIWILHNVPGNVDV